MNAILGFSQLLGYESLPPHQLAYVHEIHRAGDYLLELINELLDLARIESGKMVVVSQPVNLAAAINAATEVKLPPAEPEAYSWSPSKGLFVSR